MRRNDREVLELQRIIEIVQSCTCCRLGYVDGQEAYIVPMNFGYEWMGGELTLYFHSAKEGRKMELLPDQQVVSFEMDTGHGLAVGDHGCDFSYYYRCVMGTGTLAVLENAEEKLHGLACMMKHYTGTAQWEWEQSALDRIHVLRLSVINWSCKEHVK